MSSSSEGTRLRRRRRLPFGVKSSEISTLFKFICLKFLKQLSVVWKMLFVQVSRLSIWCGIKLIIPFSLTENDWESSKISMASIYNKQLQRHQYSAFTTITWITIKHKKIYHTWKFHLTGMLLKILKWRKLGKILQNLKNWEYFAMWQHSIDNFM